MLKNEGYSRDFVEALDLEKEKGHLADEELVGDRDHGGMDSDINGAVDVIIREEDSSADSDGPGLERDVRPSLQPPSPRTGSTAMDGLDTISSHDDSILPEGPTGRLGGILDSLSLSSRSRRPSTTSDSSALSDPARWMPLLRPAETPVFTSCVHKANRRAFPRQLLPLTVGAKKGLSAQGNRARLLVLTKTRLLCIKDCDGELIVKKEMLIGGQGGGIGVVTGVEKGEQSFVVQTVNLSFVFRCNSSDGFLPRSRRRSALSQTIQRWLSDGQKRLEMLYLQGPPQLRSSNPIQMNGHGRPNFVLFFHLEVPWFCIFHVISSPAQ